MLNARSHTITQNIAAPKGDAVFKQKSLKEVYAAAGADGGNWDGGGDGVGGFGSGGYTLPLLVHTASKKVISNDADDIMRIIDALPA
jgi:glutathionyl-hydroquinone reductase